MTKEQLFESIGQLDEALIERSHRTARPVWGQWAAAAACVCVVAAVVLAGGRAQERGSAAAEQQAAADMPVPASDWSAQPLPDKGTPPPEWDVSREIALPELPEPTAAPGEVLPPGADSLPAPTPAPSQDPSEPVGNGVFLGPGEGPQGATPPLISYYDVGGSVSDACYAVPENGTVGFSIPLRAAMEDCGSRAWYRVYVDLFADGARLAPDSPEAAAERERLASLGYIVAYETYFDGERERHYFTLHTDYEQLTDFPAVAGYGYMLFLYDERVPG